MKKILLFIATFMFCIGVNAEGVFDNLKLEFDWDYGYLRLKEEKYVTIPFKSNSSLFNDINSKDEILNMGKIYYVLNGGDEKEAELIDSKTLKINVESVLSTTNEIELEIFFKEKNSNNSEINKTKESFLIVSTLDGAGSVAISPDTNIQLSMLGVMPYNSKFTANKVTNEEVLNKIKYENPSVYEVFLTAYGKSYTYYENKYNLTGTTIKILIPVPSKYNYQKDKFNLYGYIISKNDIKAQETKINYSDSSDFWSFAITEDEYAFDSYFVFSPSKEWVEEQEPVVPAPETPAPETPEEPKYYCKKVDDKYYDKNGNVVDEAAYKASCTEKVPENPHTGIAIPFVALFTILGSILLLKKYKNKNGLRKI